ncbi:MAG TPA: RagB/SusD family nutrient uptake outer membrane protein, partial [Pricia sp.]|nr:RagB/SusD family nutrient uptake outer membrane protein [Pricia sp.]
MKNFKKYVTYTFSVVLLVGILSSCAKDFLDEELTTQRSTEYFATEDGIRSLANGAYFKVLASPFPSEQQFATTNYGTDEFHVGGDDTNSPWNNYDTRFNSVVITTRTQAQE